MNDYAMEYCYNEGKQMLGGGEDFRKSEFGDFDSDAGGSETENSEE